MMAMTTRPKTTSANPGDSRAPWFLLLAIIIGLAARMAMAAHGHNYDFSSYRVVTGILEQGGNVYARTDRYNYGPVWFQILHALDFLAGHDEKVFRYLVAGFLSLVDVGICLFLWRKFGQTAARLFILNPIPIIITGFHSQFDNLAILIGLLGVWLMGEDMDRPLTRRKFSALLVLGLSITTKHVLFAFPLWLAVKQKGTLQKAVVLLVPTLVFLLSFMPYWHEGQQGIIKNVFEYRSMTNNYFYNMFVPRGLQIIFTSSCFWLFCLGLFALVYRRKSAVDSLLAYTCVMVAASPAIASQYLAIPIAFVAVRWSALTALYTIFGTWSLAVHQNDLGLLGLLPWLSPDFAVCTLACALVWVTWQPQITAALRYLYEWWMAQIKNQLGIRG